MKSSKTTIAQRVDEIFQLILEGAEFASIRDYSREKGWGVTDSTLFRYLERARALCVKRMERDREKIIARHLFQRRAMYQRAMQAGDVRTALAVAKDEAMLFGLYGPLRIDLEGGHYVPSPELVDTVFELRAAVERLGPEAGPSPERNGRAAH
jgi:hypothetical protein